MQNVEKSENRLSRGKEKVRLAKRFFLETCLQPFGNFLERASLRKLQNFPKFLFCFLSSYFRTARVFNLMINQKRKKD